MASSTEADFNLVATPGRETEGFIESGNTIDINERHFKHFCSFY